MVNWKSKKTGDFLLLANGITAVVLLNLVFSVFFFRLDLTEEKRFTIKEPTRDLLENLDDDIYIEVYLEGDLNAGFQRLQKSIREMLEEFRIYSDNKVHYSFTNPMTASSAQAQNEFIQTLAGKGINPMNVVEGQAGEQMQRIVFPGALISYGGSELGVMLLKGNRAQGPQEVLNQSIEGLEYEFANGISNLVSPQRKRIGLTIGHGELDSLDIAGFNNALLDQFDVFKVNVTLRGRIDTYDALIMIKPQSEFSIQDKYKIDQYVMGGGKLLLLLDPMHAIMDSASRQDYFSLPVELGLSDLLFRYGVRLNSDLVQDRNSGKYPVITGMAGNQPQGFLMDWPFFPLVNQYADHVSTRNLDATLLRFASSIDTVKADGIRKTPLMFSSPYSRTPAAPVKVGINDFRDGVDPASFSEGRVALAYLLEGAFTSLFKNRFLPGGVDTSSYLDTSIPTKIAIISDGDVARNEINPRSGQPLSLGTDPLGNTFANQDLLMNIVSYLTDEQGLIEARNKEVIIRPLDNERIGEERTFWQVINLGLPLVLLGMMGIAKTVLRKRKYASF